LPLRALADQRVAYWEPAKWVARLRDRKTGDRLLLLRTDLSAGHAGAFSRFGALEEAAFIFAFVIKTAGMIEHVAAPA
jgi:oligopeptidase B